MREHLVDHMIGPPVTLHNVSRGADGQLWISVAIAGSPGTSASHSTKPPTPAFAIVEFDMVGETVRGPFRQAMVYVMDVREGRVDLLRELVDTAALSELFQVGA